MSTPTIDRPDLTELRTRAVTLASEVAEMRSTPEADRGENFAAELRQRAAELYAIDAEERVVSRAADTEWSQLAWDQAVAEAEARKIKGPDAAFDDLDGPETRGPVGLALDTDAYREWREGDGTGRSFPHLELRGIHNREQRTLITSGTGSGEAGVLRNVLQPIPPVPRQLNLVMRDLIPSTEVGASSGSIPYVRETNAATNEGGATAVAEGEAKPEVTMEFDDASAVIAKLAAWAAVTDEILADAPLLRGYIENRLLYMLGYREQHQFLNGGGGAANIEGLLVVSGTQTQNAVNDDPAATLALSFGKVENVDAAANGVVMNPLDFWTGVAERHANQFDGDANGTAPVGTPPQTTWGVPTVRTRAIAQGTALVGDFVLGAQIWDRQSAVLRTSDSHDDFFVKNKQAVLVEERVALPIFRPDVFVKATINFT